MAVKCFRVAAQGGYIPAVEFNLDLVPPVAFNARRRGPAEFDVRLEADEPVSVSMKSRTAVVTPITLEHYEAD